MTTGGSMSQEALDYIDLVADKFVDGERERSKGNLKKYEAESIKMGFVNLWKVNIQMALQKGNARSIHNISSTKHNLTKMDDSERMTFGDIVTESRL